MDRATFACAARVARSAVYLLMSCQKPWREPTAEQMANVKRWYEDIQPDEGMRKALISIHKSGLTGLLF